MKNWGIHVEMTALLDVIFIIMFLILVQSETQVASAHLEVTESGEAREELVAELQVVATELELISTELEEVKRGYDTLQRMETGRTVVEANSLIINLSVHPNDDGRIISVELMGDLLEEIELDWDNRNYAANLLYAVVSENIRSSDAQATFIVFEYDRNEIFQADYSLITNAIQRLRQQPYVFSIVYDINLQGDNYVE
jgi:hypothetical protein